jgi:hypothetical protein
MKGEEKTEKQEAKRRKRLMKRYAASMLLVVLLTLAQALTLSAAFTWGALARMLVGPSALGAYAAGLADLRRRGASGATFVFASRWVFFIYLAALLLTSYL